MGSIFKNFLGLSAAKDEGTCLVSPQKKPVRALPASWYLSENLYQLERRALFSKKWLLTTHTLRIPNPGNWSRYGIAGYPFILARGHNHKINAFHDIWGDRFNDELAETLLADENRGLVTIHVHTDVNDFIWINLDADEQPEIAWERDFKDIDLQPRFKHFNFEDYVYDHSWEMEGAYNWKLLADNYNECYHCLTAHPDVPTLADLNSYDVDTKDGSIIHFANARQDTIDAGLEIASTYYFPNASMTVSPHFFFMQRFVPTSPTSCDMLYEVYRKKTSDEKDFQLINEMYKRIMSEDKYLCVEAQKNLSTGVFVNGLLHPHMEKGPLYFQSVVRDNLMEHFDREQKAGTQIWPAQVDVKKAQIEAVVKKQTEADNHLPLGAEDVKSSMGMTTQITETAVF
jgi:phenylpropionate dioxygenase-like ring-hydroxylating dioxygenase large terminal subunit